MGRGGAKGSEAVGGDEGFSCLGAAGELRRGWAGGLAEICKGGGKGRLGGIENNNSQSLCWDEPAMMKAQMMII